MGWTTFLDRAPPAEHGVQIYSELDELAASVGRFLDAGFAAREPAIVIATAGHRPVFAAELERRGREARELEKQGLLTWRDADETLAAFMDGGAPSPGRFEEVVGGLVDEVARRFPQRTVRAFGEMVDVLVRRRQKEAAIALEELWNGLLAGRNVALLCGYELDVFDLETQASALPEICRTHTHSRPVADPGRLASAVHEALTDVLGADAAWVYLRVAEEVPVTSLARAQAVLMWLSKNKPRTARRVLADARLRYAAAAA